MRSLVVLILFFSLLFNSFVVADESGIKNVSMEDLYDKMYQKDEKVKIMFVFTSWCGVCRKAMPDLVALNSKFIKSGDAEIIALSLDNNNQKLQTYIEKIENNNLEIYVPNSVMPKDILSMFVKLNVGDYNGSIPYIVITKGGRFIASGNYDVNSLYDAVKYLSAQKVSE